MYVRVHYFSKNSTKPNPLCFPVALSSGMFTSFTSPNGVKAVRRISSVTFSSKPPALNYCHC